MTFQATIRSLAAACCIFATIPAPADEPGRRYFSANASRVPEADFRGLPPGNDVRTSDNQVAAAFARISHESLRVDFGFDYQYTRYQYNELDSRNRDLHRVQLPIWLSAPVQNWQLHGHVAPGIFTSSNVLGDFFNRGSSDDLYVTGRFEAARNGSSMPWILGFAHDRSFGRSRTYPVVGIKLSPDDSLDVRLAWPDPALRYRPSDRQMLTFEVFPAGNQSIACDPVTEDLEGTDDSAFDELCTLAGYCAPRSAEVRFCMKTCVGDADCRNDYECRDEALMIEHGGEPVPPVGESVATEPTPFCAAAPA